MGRASILAVALVLGAPACALFVDLDGLSGGAAPSDGGTTPPPDDAAPPAVDGAVPVVDASHGGDAGAPDSAPPPEPFCKSSSATFCEDFDQGIRSPMWTRDVRGASVVLELDPRSDARHAPFALRFGITASAMADEVQYEHVLAGPAVSHFRWSYDLYIEEWPTSGSAEVNTIQLDTDNGPCWVFLELQAGTARIKEESNFAGVFKSEIPFAQTGLVAQRWHRVVIEADIAEATPTFALSVDGIPLGGVPLKLMMRGSARLSAGIGWTAGSTTARALVDNITFERLP